MVLQLGSFDLQSRAGDPSARLLLGIEGLLGLRLMALVICLQANRCYFSELCIAAIGATVDAFEAFANSSFAMIVLITTTIVVTATTNAAVSFPITITEAAKSIGYL